MRLALVLRSKVPVYYRTVKPGLPDGILRGGMVVSVVQVRLDQRYPLLKLIRCQTLRLVRDSPHGLLRRRITLQARDEMPVDVGNLVPSSS